MQEIELPSARAFLRKWVREQVAELDEVQVSELADEAMQYLENHNLLDEFIVEVVRSMVTSETRSTMSAMRRSFKQVGDLILTNETLDRRARQLRLGVWPTWMRAPEWVGDHHIVPAKMTHNELLAAANLREQRGDQEQKMALLWRTLAARLDPTEPLMVEDVFKPEEVEELRRQIMLEE